MIVPYILLAIGAVLLGALGAIAVPVNFRLTPDEVGYVLEDSGAVAVVTDSLLALPALLLALILVYGKFSTVGGWLEDNGIQIIFSLPGMVLATVFVSMPFVAREVAPVLKEIGEEQEQAAATLGANAWQTFWKVVFPVLRPINIVIIVVTVIESLRAFDLVYITNQGGIGLQLISAMITDVVEDAFAATGYCAADIDWFVPHQANKRIIDASAHKLHIAPQKVVLTVDLHGNTSAASIPLALSVAVADGRVKKGDLVLLEAMGGGFTWGSALVRW